MNGREPGSAWSSKTSEIDSIRGAPATSATRSSRRARVSGSAGRSSRRRRRRPARSRRRPHAPARDRSRAASRRARAGRGGRRRSRSRRECHRRRDVDRLQARVRQQLVDVAGAERETVLLGELGRALRPPRPDGDRLELVEAGEDGQRHLGAVAAAGDGDLDGWRGHARGAGYGLARAPERAAGSCTGAGGSSRRSSPACCSPSACRRRSAGSARRRAHGISGCAGRADRALRRTLALRAAHAAAGRGDPARGERWCEGAAALFLHGGAGRDGEESNANGAFFAALERSRRAGADRRLPERRQELVLPRARVTVDWGRYVLEEVIPRAVKRTHADPPRVAIGGISMAASARTLARMRPSASARSAATRPRCWRAAARPPPAHSTTPRTSPATTSSRSGGARGAPRRAGAAVARRRHGGPVSPRRRGLASALGHQDAPRRARTRATYWRGALRQLPALRRDALATC